MKVLMLIAHGSRNQAANDEVSRLADAGSEVSDRATSMRSCRHSWNLRSRTSTGASSAVPKWVRSEIIVGALLPGGR